ncbi:Alpha/Beta hydrolase protein [Tricharina praecox]|uniref:Alpha/Beta hydrolase protein n=1 Tax=Tricharina praecox TaxID=43433 RepID=UPI00221EBC40|nr:Alpha/Beta hydrolase protein [Tricharina praecox]KAI5849167.1 Alpha/Beta hydrolase protein [Tricharina praecox]
MSSHADISTEDSTSFPYIYRQNVSIPLKTSDASAQQMVRGNIYLPHSIAEGKKFPVLVTYGPYGKDIHYRDFRLPSYQEVNPKHHSEHSAWETPDPGFWTSKEYVVIRCDERGIGASPGRLNTMSRGTAEAFFDVVEWASEQPWSSGKVGLLGISYYAGSQWRVAARQPKGLAAIVPWEGMSDYYRDRCRHGGILANNFIKFWWNRQVVVNQHGRGELSEQELEENRRDQNIDNRNNKFRDDEYYASKEYSMEDVTVPLLSVANWGGILLHLRGNVEGWVHAGSKLKYLRFITGRHDLPFYYDEEVEVQLSFLDAFLKDDDRVGWSVPGKVPPVDLVLRKGDVGFNNAIAEKAYTRRTELEWPIARTIWQQYHLTPDDLGLVTELPTISHHQKVSYPALGSIQSPQFLHFTTAPFETETEITGNVVAHLNVSVTPDPTGPTPSDIDLFLTLRHLSADGKEIFYTGTAGDPAPLTKGWLRVSLRKVNTEHARHRSWLPHRDYFSTDVQPVIPGEIYPVDVEIWPTNVVVEKGARIVFEVASGDTQGSSIFLHNEITDRPEKIFRGRNHLHFGPKFHNYVTLPVIPSQ